MIHQGQRLACDQPMILAENAGHNSSDFVTRLWAAQYEEQTDAGLGMCSVCMHRVKHAADDSHRDKNKTLDRGPSATPSRSGHERGPALTHERPPSQHERAQPDIRTTTQPTPRTRTQSTPRLSRTQSSSRHCQLPSARTIHTTI